MKEQALGVKFRPHVKTHKTHELARLQLGYGIAGHGLRCGFHGKEGKASGPNPYASLLSGIVASTLAEVRFFAETSWTVDRQWISRILYGVPLCPSKIGAVLELQREFPMVGIEVRGCVCVVVAGECRDGQHPHSRTDPPMPTKPNLTKHTQVLVDLPDTLSRLLATIAGPLSGTSTKLGVWIKVDCGYHRAGLEGLADIEALARRIVTEGEGRGVQFAGVYSHSGHSYDARGSRERILGAC